jgi:hypothetical protein
MSAPAVLLLIALASRVAGGAAGLPGPPDGRDSLHERIDRLIESGLEGERAAPATDAEFLRRAWLDLCGVIPTSAEARSFLDDPSPYKRGRLVERLLESRDYVRRMQTYFDVMWIERRSDQNAPGEAWRGFLQKAIERNVPYDELCRMVLSADGSEGAGRGAARFLLAREGDPNTLVRDIGRLFLGRDMQCAQCHDHPLIDDYKQAHYYGLFAFLNRSYLVKDARGVPMLGEKAEGDVSFSSVFKKKETHTTGPRVLDGVEVPDAPVEKGQEYWVFPADGVKAIPRDSRRARLAASVASPEQRAFRANIVNRLWAMMMGLGLVHPLDLHHEDNPPSHPELLELLGDEFAAMNYDVKSFLRELASTRTYARSSEPPPGASEEVLAPELFAVAGLKPLSPEQLAWSAMQATGVLAANRAAAEREIVGVDPRLAAIAAGDATRGRLVRELVERRLEERLRGAQNAFVTQFGGVAGQDQDGGQSTVHQALFLSNGEPLQSWLASSGENLTARLMTLEDASSLAEELYLAILSRRPSVEERAEVARYLEERAGEREMAVRELAWALLTSAEFRFNH